MRDTTLIVCLTSTQFSLSLFLDVVVSDSADSHLPIEGPFVRPLVGSRLELTVFCLCGIWFVSGVIRAFYPKKLIPAVPLSLLYSMCFSERIRARALRARWGSRNSAAVPATPWLRLSQ